MTGPWKGQHATHGFAGHWSPRKEAGGSPLLIWGRDLNLRVDTLYGVVYVMLNEREGVR